MRTDSRIIESCVAVVERPVFISDIRPIGLFLVANVVSLIGYRQDGPRCPGTNLCSLATLTVLFTCSCASSHSPEYHEAADRALEIGNRYHESGRREAASQAWGLVKDEYPGSEAWTKAVFNLGLQRRAASEYSKAIEEFVAVRDGDVNDLEPGGNLMEV